MAKKIRFPLEMDGGTEVRDVAGLRESFSLQRVMGYLSDGKLVTWLRDRYENELADAVEAIDGSSPDAAQKLCAIFDVPFDEEQLERDAERSRKQQRLREYTEDPQYLDHAEYAVFEQDDLYDLLDEGANTVYLCGDTFSIPLGQPGVTYIGVNDPTVVINAKEAVNWEEKQIELVNVRYDAKYQAVLDSAKAEQPTQTADSVAAAPTRATPFGAYRDSYLSFLLSPAEQQAAKESFALLSDKLAGVRYDVDADIRHAKEMLKSSGVVACARDFLNRL